MFPSVNLLLDFFGDLLPVKQPVILPITIDSLIGNLRGFKQCTHLCSLVLPRFFSHFVKLL